LSFLKTSSIGPSLPGLTPGLGCINAGCWNCLGGTGGGILLIGGNPGRGGIPGPPEYVVGVPGEPSFLNLFLSLKIHSFNLSLKIIATTRRMIKMIRIIQSHSKLPDVTGAI